MTFHYPIGTHLLIELYGCTATKFTEKDLKELAKDTKSHPLGTKMHQFKPQGQTGIIILEESHISIHTYPEFGYAAVDIFTCGTETKPYEAIDRLKKLFNPKYVQINEVQRGVNA